MPPKPKPNNQGKPTIEQEAQERANAVVDIADEDHKKQLRKECRELEKAIEKEEKLTALYNDERLRINYFWLVGKKELEDKQAELRNKEREYADLEEKHQIEIKIWKQRIKHLVFQNLDQLTQLKKDAQITLKNTEDEHRINERELKQDLRALKVQKKEQEMRQKEYLNALTKDKNKEMTAIRNEFERIAKEIQQKYKYKMQLLRNDMEKKRKAEIAKIENQKNTAIKELCIRVEDKYKKIREYYLDICNTNMDIIRQLKEDVADANKENAQKTKDKQHQQEMNNAVVEPLNRATKEVKEKEKDSIKHEKIKRKLEKLQDDIAVQKKLCQETEWQYEVRLQQFQYLEKEKKQLFDEFHRLVYEIHQKTGLRNLILEKKLETIQESLETKDAQINQILAAARIDPQALGMIRSTLEEVENLKNESIKDIQTELKKIREAHSNMVKTYEGKLSEFGIPVEELGFDPLVPANI